MQHQKSKCFSVGFRQLWYCLIQLRHGISNIWVGCCLCEHMPATVGNQWFLERPEKVLHHSCQSVDVVMWQVWTASSSKELLFEVLDLFLTTRNSVETHFIEAACFNLIDTMDNQSWHHWRVMGYKISQLATSVQTYNWKILTEIYTSKEMVKYPKQL